MSKVKNSGIEFVTGEKTYNVNLSEREEAFELLTHLFKNVPTFSKKAKVKNQDSYTSSLPRDETSLATAEGTHFSEGEEGTQLFQTNFFNPVNTSASESALRKILEAQEMGVQSLQELSRQKGNQSSFR